MGSSTMKTGTEELQATVEHHVAVLRLNRPHRRNALSTQLLAGLSRSLAECERDPDRRVIVLTGAGCAFCAGGDVKEVAQNGALAGPDRVDLPIHEKVAQQRIAQREVSGLLYCMSEPTIASLPGAAARAGLSLALACDFRIAAESAILVTAFADVGLSGDFGGSWFLTRLGGVARATELYVLSDRLTAMEALSLGIVNTVVSASELASSTGELAARLARGPGIAYGYMKENIHRALDSGLIECMDAEATHHVYCATTSDHREAAKAFVDWRRPVFGGRWVRPIDREPHRRKRQLLPSGVHRELPMGSQDSSEGLSMTTMSFPAIVRRFAREKPDQVAITDGLNELTWSDLDKQSEQIAYEYLRLGVRKGTFVALLLPNGGACFICSIAAWKVGATPLPLSPELPRREQEDILKLAGAPLVVLGEGLERSKGVSYDVLASRSAGVHEEPLPDVTSRRWKAITSGGSTGRPKIIVALEPAEADPEIGIDAFGMRPGARQIVAGPLYHNGPYVSAVRGLMCGGSLVIPGRFDAANVLDTVSRRGINWMLLVPTMMLRMLRADPERGHDLTSLDAILHLGGPCPAWVKRGWIDWLGPEKVLELYGSTEGQAVTIISGTEWLDHPGSVGRPGRYVLDRGLAGSSLDARIDIWDAELQPVASGVVGEIWSKVDLDSPGYEYVGAEVRRERGWESVGDLGWKDDEGYLYIADRRIDLVVTGGANVYPAEVEAVISEHPKVRDCVVIGLPDEALGRSVHAIVEVEDGLNLSDLQEFVHERLVRYKVPRTWEVAAKLARNDAGKIRRTALVVERSEHCAKAN